MRHVRSAAIAVGIAVTALPPGAAQAAEARRAPFGTLADGTAVEAVTLTARNGVTARIISFGATLQAYELPDRDGRMADVELGYDDLAGYVAHPNYWGASVGRYANRIAGGTFQLGGKSYRLSQNDKANSLHGGAKGFDRLPWRIVSVAGGATARVTLALTSPAGDQGYPGTLRVTVSYALDDAGNLTMDYDAKTDAPTIVNLTNHAIFNLAGEGAPGGILRHRLTVPAARYTPVDAALIPTGELRAVAGTPFDFTRPRTIEDGIRDGRDPQIVFGRGVDHNFVLDAGRTAAPKLGARLEDPASGRVLEVWSDQPGMQVYTGNFLDGTLVGKRGHLYRMADGIALEPQTFPDTPNQPAFGSALVTPAKPYHHRMMFRPSMIR